MTDYYGLDDLSMKRSITETLVEHYRRSTDRIAEGYDRRREGEEAGSNGKPPSATSIESQKLEGDANSSLWQLTKSYLHCKISHLVYGIYGAAEPDDFIGREKIESLSLQKKIATSYQSWLRICNQLDELQKFNEWKELKESKLYDYKLIERSLEELKAARLNGDIRKILYLIRTTWTRNIGNIGNVNLYRHSHTGTKKLIEDYQQECFLALEEVTKANNSHGIDDRYILSMLVQTRKNIGRTALMLSGGGCFGLFHIGVLAALLEENVLPRVISGSSAGAIVASILCVHTNDEIGDLIETIVDRKFDIFDSSTKKEGILLCLSRFLKYGTWYDNTNLQNTMIEFLGDLTFREAYNRTGRILNITVSPASVHEHPRLLNYLTAPSVLIWSAVCASCSLPGIFESSTIYEKNMKTGATQEWHHTSVKFVDGSVDNDLPITRLSEMFNVDHIIACQVNPHVVPFLKLSVTCVGGEIETEYSAKLKTKLGQFYDIWASEVSHYLQMSAELGIARNICTKLRSVLSQQYSGDITILPDLKEVARLNKLLANPTPQYLLHCTMKGASSTWPKISIIKNHCGLEFALDNAIKQLRGRNFKNLNSNLALINSPNFFGSNNEIPEPQRISLDNFYNKAHQHTPRSERKQRQSHTTGRHHGRHRSETLSVSGMKALRATKSTLSVGSGEQSSSRTPGYSKRYHRSYSASNEAASYYSPVEFSLPVSEASSPLGMHVQGGDSYFRSKRNSQTNLAGSPGKLALKKPNSNSQSTESLNSKLNKVHGAPLYVNIDFSDGLFAKSSEDDNEDDADPVKVDAGNSSSPEVREKAKG